MKELSLLVQEKFVEYLNQIDSADFDLGEFLSNEDETRHDLLAQILRFHLEDTFASIATKLDIQQAIDRLKDSDIDSSIVLQLKQQLETQLDRMDIPAQPQSPSTKPTSSLEFSIPGLTLIRKLGQGGMGTVFEAQHANSNETVAVKTFSTEAAGGRSRFLREYRVLNKLSHANIVPVYKFGEHEDVVYYSMPVLNGGSLADVVPVVSKQSWDDCKNRVLKILTSLCDAVEYAHAHDIIHRDIKPSNILFNNDGRVFLCDFGIAKMLNEQTLSDQTSGFIGTFRFCAPESLADNLVDKRSDIYAIGAVLFNLLTDTSPYGDDLKTIFEAKNFGRRPNSLTDSRSDVPQDIVEITRKCLEPIPEDRFQNVAELSAAIKSVAKGSSYKIKPIAKSKRLLNWWSASKSNRRNTYLAVAIGACVIGGYFVTSQRSNQLTKRAEANLGTSIDALELILDQTRNRFAPISDLERKKLSSDAQDISSKIIDQNPDDDFAKFAKAKVLRIQGDLLAAFGESGDVVLKPHREAVELLKELTNDEFDEAKIFRERTLNELAIGQALITKDELEDGEQIIESITNTSIETIVESGISNEVIEAHMSLANLNRSRRDYASSLKELGKASLLIEAAGKDKVKDQLEITLLDTSGVVCLQAGNLTEGEKHFQSAIAAIEKCDLESNWSDYYTGNVCNNLGALYLKKSYTSADPKKDREDAIRLLEKSLNTRRRLLLLYPERLELSQRVNQATTNLSLTYQQHGEVDKTRKLFSDLIAERRKIVSDAPDRPNFSFDLANTLYQNARFESEQKNGELANKLISEAIAFLSNLETEQTAKKEYRLANMFAARAENFNRQKRYLEAVNDWNVAIERCDPRYKPGYLLGRIESKIQFGKIDDAIKDLDDISDSFSTGAEIHNLATQYVLCAQAYKSDAPDLYDESMKKAKAAIERFPSAEDRVRFFAQFDDALKKEIEDY